MGWSTRGAIAALFAVAVLLRAELCAGTPLENLRARVSSSALSGKDALLFHTEQNRVVVLADQAGRIGAILVRSKSKNHKVSDETNALVSLVESAERPDISYSRDEHSAIILYRKIAENQADESRNIIGTTRLVALYNVTRAGDFAWVPYRWFEGGASFRYYAGKVAAEITVDMTREVVEYAELRVSNRFREIGAEELLAFHSGFSVRGKLAASLGKRAEVISSNTLDDTHLVLRQDVYLAGKASRLRHACQNGSDSEHHVFPALKFPAKEAVMLRVDKGGRNAMAAKLSRPSGKERLKLGHLYNLLGRGAYREGLHTWKSDKGTFSALVNRGREVEGFIISGDNALVNKLEKVFSTPDKPVRLNMRGGKGALLLYPGEVSSESLPGRSLAVVLRSLLAGGDKCTEVRMENGLLHMSFETRVVNLRLQMVFDAGCAEVKRIHIIPSVANSQSTESEICRMLGLTNPVKMQSETRERWAESLQGRVVYMQRNPTMVLCYGKNSRYYTVGSSNLVKAANMTAAKRFPAATDWAEGTAATLPEHAFNPEDEKKAREDEPKPAPAPLTPKAAREAYIDYLRKL